MRSLEEITQSRQKTCRRKKRYKYFNHARFDASYLASKDQTEMDVYLCEFCGFYHVGHSINREEMN